MATERRKPVAVDRSAMREATDREVAPQPLFGTKIRSTLEEIRELRERRGGERRAEVPQHRPLFGNKVRDTLAEIADLRERRRAARGIARDN